MVVFPAPFKPTRALSFGEKEKSIEVWFLK
jgi:hypothetical protein